MTIEELEAILLAMVIDVRRCRATNALEAAVHDVALVKKTAHEILVRASAQGQSMIDELMEEVAMVAAAQNPHGPKA